MDDLSASYRAAFEQAPLGIFLLEPISGTIFETNQRFADIVGRARADLAGLNWTQMTFPDDALAESDNIARLNAGEISRFHMTKRYVRPDGSYVWVSISVAPLNVPAGGGPTHMCVVEDITERKAMEDALRERVKEQKCVYAVFRGRILI